MKEKNFGSDQPQDFQGRECAEYENLSHRKSQVSTLKFLVQASNNKLNGYRILKLSLLSHVKILDFSK